VDHQAQLSSVHRKYLDLGADLKNRSLLLVGTACSKVGGFRDELGLDEKAKDGLQSNDLLVRYSK